MSSAEYNRRYSRLYAVKMRALHTDEWYAAQPETIGTCTKCGRSGANGIAFYKNRSYPKGFDLVCRRCSGKRSVWYNYLYRRGITREASMRLWEDAGRSCQICAKSLGPEEFKIDHNHTTGTIRGVLCHQCNIGLGCFADNQDTMNKAIAYLKERAV